jgi:hypothetical protein
MRFIKSILQKVLPKELPKPMGRWAPQECNIKLNQRIDLSNEDHCGPCGQYVLSKQEEDVKKNNISRVERSKDNTSIKR